MVIRGFLQLDIISRRNSLFTLAFARKLVMAAAVFLCLLPSAATAKDRLIGLRLGDHSEKTRIVLDLSGKLPYALFTLSDPYRVVIDLPELEWSASSRTANTNTGLVSGYRFGLFQPGNSRFVLDLREPAKVANIYFLAAPEGAKNARLVIDLERTDRASFLQTVGFKGRAASTIASRPAVKPASPAVPPLAAPAETNTGIAGRMPPANPHRAQAPVAQAPAATLAALPPMIAPGGKITLKRPRTVVIDAGHGGVDPGAMTASGQYEKHIVLDTAKRLHALLSRDPRYKIIMTRERDVFVRLGDRVQVAREAQADLFVSIHADALNSRKVRGASVYTLSEGASDEEAALLAEKENNSDMIAGISIGDETDEMVKNILIDLAQRETTNKSVHFAKLLLPELRSSGALLKNSHRYAGFRVLKAPDVPSVLIELGLLSNATDAKTLTSERGRQRLAAAVKAAIDAYFRNFET